MQEVLTESRLPFFGYHCTSNNKTKISHINGSQAISQFSPSIFLTNSRQIVIVIVNIDFVMAYFGIVIIVFYNNCFATLIFLLILLLLSLFLLLLLILLLLLLLLLSLML